MTHCQCHLLILFLFACSSFPFELSARTTRVRNGRLRVMTFNIWNSGANVVDGISKIAAQIKMVNPHIVSLQEVEAGVFPQILAHLGPQWRGVERKASSTADHYPDTAIATRLLIYDQSYAATVYGMSLKLKAGFRRNVSVWSMHLDWRNSNGAYAACLKLCTDPSQLEAGEYALGSSEPSLGSPRPSRISRMENIRNLVAHPVFQLQRSMAQLQLCTDQLATMRF